MRLDLPSANCGSCNLFDYRSVFSRAQLLLIWIASVQDALLLNTYFLLQQQRIDLHVWKVRST